MKTIILAATMACGIAFAPAASAATLATCNTSDILPGAQSCVGFVSGNILNTANLTDQRDALAKLGLTNWSGTAVETLSSLKGAQTITFDTMLKGISYIGLHFGNGQGGPGNGTAIYRIDAGAGLQSIQLAYKASSNAVLFSTNVAAVPEPATWALMILGFSMMGFALRRSRKAAVETATSLA